MPTPATTKVPLKAWGGLAILMTFFMLYFIDKQMVGLLANILGPALNLSDLQIGLLTGYIFTIPYAVGVILAGMAVDRYSRTMLLFIGVFGWSLMAASSGLASSYGTLALFRGGLGVAEAMLVPAAMSLIPSLFPRERLSLALGIYYSSATAGGIVAVLLGGRIIDAFVRHGVWDAPILGPLQPWQSVFLVTGAPGLLLAFLAFALPVRDRLRRTPSARDDGSVPSQSFMSYVRTHWRFLIPYVLAVSSGGICSLTLLSWTPAYFGRTYHWDHSSIGWVLAMGLGFGAVGNIIWGAACDVLRRRGHPDAVYRVFIPLLLATPPLAFVAFMVNSPALALPAFAFSCMVYQGLGPVMSGLQLATPSHLRGRVTAAHTVVTSVLGTGLGPVIVGFLTTNVFHSKEMLGEALVLSVSGASLLAAFFYAIGRSAYRRAVLEEERPGSRPAGSEVKIGAA